MTVEFSPALIFLVGAALVPLWRQGAWRSAYLLLLPLLAFAQVLALPHGEFGQVQLFSMTLTTLRVDKLSLLFAYIFTLAALLNTIFALHLRDTAQQTAGVVYAGGALGAVFAGDLVTVLIFWEVLAVASVFLVWASRTERAFHAGMRYLLMHLGSGVLLLAGIAMYHHAGNPITFGAIDIDAPGGVLILLAFGVKCAFPLLHGWLTDAYPEATPTGTALLSAFTTKVAVYALARGFAGADILIIIGAAMTAFPIFYAVIENDLRRVLAYSLINQLGFMVVGIGIGTELAINGAVAHAFADILFKGLLLMSMGAVLFRVGTVKGSELGGLYKSMPWTAGFCVVGAASISAFPLFSGFVTKSMIITASMEQGHFWLWLVLLFASAGVFHHAGIKIPYFAFFAHDSGKRCAEAPLNMLVAMGLSAALCIGIGVFPGFFYSLLPFVAEYHPYSLDHVAAQVQLLFFSALAFAVLMRTGIYPPELPSTNIDADWLYRRLGRGLLERAGKVAHAAGVAVVLAGSWVRGRLGGPLTPETGGGQNNATDSLSGTWSTRLMAASTAAMLGFYLLLLYWVVQ